MSRRSKNPEPVQPRRAARRGLFWVVISALIAIAVIGRYGLHAWSQKKEREEGLRLAKQERFEAAAPLLKAVLARDPSDVEVLKILALNSTDPTDVERY